MIIKKCFVSLFKDYLIKLKQALQKQKEELKPGCDKLCSLQGLIDLYKPTNLISKLPTLDY